MTTSFVLQPQPFRRGPSTEAALVVGIVAVVAVATLFVAGLTFFGLSIRLAGFWWLFAGLSIASFAGAAVVAVKATHFVSPHD